MSKKKNKVKDLKFIACGNCKPFIVIETCEHELKEVKVDHKKLKLYLASTGELLGDIVTLEQNTADDTIVVGFEEPSGRVWHSVTFKQVPFNGE